ncbi:hypothetical protein VRK_34260 [Vibrio sp. MEBiC08052]|nr:hypothetical protein VRK_34260 [Vibrio sp. MEBiC08052]
MQLSWHSLEMMTHTIIRFNIPYFESLFYHDIKTLSMFG